MKAPDRVDLYDSAYSNYESELYRQIRIETYGEDLGQTSWVTIEESDKIPKLLAAKPKSTVLEIGSGSGRYALRFGANAGCKLVGLDINPHGIATANQLAREMKLDSQVRFKECDVSKRLPFGGGSFDAAFANDVLCHIPDRGRLLEELFRVLRPKGRLLFSDALVIGGLVSHEEIAIRSSIGLYVFSPPGENERLIAAAGFHIQSVLDTSEEASVVATRWREARAARSAGLIAVEGEATFSGLQRFLDCVRALTSEKRLLRQVYVAQKPG